MSTFEERLELSHPFVVRVADYMLTRGWEVDYDKPVADGRADSGDIKIRRPGDEPWNIVEVKSHPNYTSEKMKKFPVILIDQVAIYDAKPVKPMAYAIVCSDMDNAVVFDCKYSDKFTVAPYRDQGDGELKDCYQVLPQYCTWISMEKTNE